MYVCIHTYLTGAVHVYRMQSENMFIWCDVVSYHTWLGYSYGYCIPCVGLDDWFNTGDLGIIDAKFGLRLCGRTKDVIIINGNNFESDECEKDISKLPGIILPCSYCIPHARTHAPPTHPPPHTRVLAWFLLADVRHTYSVCVDVHTRVWFTHIYNRAVMLCSTLVNIAVWNGSAVLLSY